MILKYGGVEYTFQLAMCRANLARVAWGQGGGALGGARADGFSSVRSLGAVRTIADRTTAVGEMTQEELTCGTLIQHKISK